MNLKHGEGSKFNLKENQIIEIKIESQEPQLSDLWFPGYHAGLTIDNNIFSKEGEKYYRISAAIVGTFFYNNREEKVLQLTEQSKDFLHDLTMPGCRRSVYARRGNPNKRGCRDILAEVYGIPVEEIGNTINLFYEKESAYPDYDKFRIKFCRAQQNDFVKIKALKDVELGVTACPADPNVAGKGELNVLII